MLGEPARHREPSARKGVSAVVDSIVAPLVEFFQRRGALLVLLFVLLHKIGDTLANLTFRLLFNDLQYTNDEIAVYDVGFGFWAYLAGIFIGGMLYTRLGMKRSVLLSLVLMARVQLEFRGPRGAGSFQLGDGGGDRLREPGERYRRRDGRRVFFRALRSALHRYSVRADLRGSERRRDDVDGNERRRAHRDARLRELLSADDGARVAGDHSVLADDALGFVDASVGTAATTRSTNRAAPATPNSRTLPSGRGS